MWSKLWLQCCCGTGTSKFFILRLQLQLRTAILNHAMFVTVMIFQATKPERSQARTTSTNNAVIVTAKTRFWQPSLQSISEIASWETEKQAKKLLGLKSVNNRTLPSMIAKSCLEIKYSNIELYLSEARNNSEMINLSYGSICV